MRIRTIKFFKWLSLGAITLLIILNGYYIGVSMTNIVRDNSASVIDPQKIEAKLILRTQQVPFLALNLTDALLGNASSSEDNGSLFQNVDSSLFSFNDTGAYINNSFYKFNNSFTAENLIEGITFNLSLPLTVNNSGYYDIDSSTFTLELSNATSKVSLIPITIPRIPRQSTQSFLLNCSLSFTSLASFNDFADIFQNPQILEISIQTTLFFFFPVRVHLIANLTEVSV